MSMFHRSRRARNKQFVGRLWLEHMLYGYIPTICPVPPYANALLSFRMEAGCPWDCRIISRGGFLAHTKLIRLLTSKPWSDSSFVLHSHSPSW